MAYAALFLVLGLAQMGLAGYYGGIAWMLAWSGLSFTTIGLAYAGVGPRVFGKRADGSLSPASLVVLLPFLLFTWLVWHVQVLLERGPAAHEIAPNLWLGRRPRRGEIPADVSLIVDLTAEFAESGAIRTGREYLCVPTLDSRAPDIALLRDAVERAAAWRGGVFVHCANGSGRSSTFAAALLIRKGLCSGVEEAKARLRSIRPAVRLYPEQQAAVRVLGEGFAAHRS